MQPDRRAARLIARQIGWLQLDVSPKSSSPLSQLESVLERHRADALLSNRSPEGRALRAAVRILVAESRRSDPQRVERLLVPLRSAFRAFRWVQAALSLPTRDALWSRIVSLCCEEFYGTRPISSEGARTRFSSSNGWCVVGHGW
jgi:hypothetical protein